jgi:hypothetical protein
MTTMTEAKPKGDVELQRVRTQIQCHIEIDGIIIYCKLGPI